MNKPISEPLSDVDVEIYACLNLDSPKSFFLFAGAGSGKTRSLVNVLQKFKTENLQRLRLTGQKVAVITYTNAACDEIKRRLEFDPFFAVSTIHSFAWELIKNFHTDIGLWKKQRIEKEIFDLWLKQGKTKTNGNAVIDEKINTKYEQLDKLAQIEKFTYNPSGANSTRDALNHAEVIKIAADFLLNKPLMQKILVMQFPILLIDESQDTQKELVDAFFAIQKQYSAQFTLGLLGDMMQRIFMDGKAGLDKNLPDTWAKPIKQINYRCPKRVITLINKIRGEQPQIAGEKNIEGVVRLFIVDANQTVNKDEVEFSVKQQMSVAAGDENWQNDIEVKTLILEHLMAARRGGFLDFFEPLSKLKKESTGLRDGTMSGVSFLLEQILPLADAIRAQNDFKIADIARKFSPLLKPEQGETVLQIEHIQQAKQAVDKLSELFANDNEPTLFDLLVCINQGSLLNLPDVFSSVIRNAELCNQLCNEFGEAFREFGEQDETIEAWRGALKSSLAHLRAYAEYIADRSRFGTHQGVKGLEFPCVMVILDDEEAGGFLFSYEKLFRAKALSKTDLSNAEEGKENSMDRTLRLFYVTCSRAEKSLAVVAYSKNAMQVKQHAMGQDWFAEHEIVML